MAKHLGVYGYYLQPIGVTSNQVYWYSSVTHSIEMQIKGEASTSIYADWVNGKLF